MKRGILKPKRKPGRRAHSTTKNPDGPNARSARRGTPRDFTSPPFPLWEYRQKAQAQAEETGKSYTQILEELLNRPFRMCWPPDDHETDLPSVIMEETGDSAEAFLSSYETIHELGLLEWDPIQLIHLARTP